MRILWLQFISEMKLFIRYKVTVFWTFLFPVFFMVLFGLLNFGSGGNIRYIDFLLPAMIMMALITTCIISTSIAFVINREKGYYRRLFVTPLKKWKLIGGQVMSRFIIVFLQTMLLIAIAVLFFEATMPGRNVVFWLVLFMAIVTFLSLGFFLASVVTREESVQPISMIVFFVMIFLGGAFWPVSQMPTFMQKISRLLPSTYLSDALFKITIAGAGLNVLGKHFLVMAIWLIIFSVATVAFFKWE